ncbi:SCO family protein [Niallia sp. Krafla_26]|uniref:SCO family protein n=1 Tax=Niallia sp. Krafla_26 TaxID=3064703 RepID=UPI003D16D3C4
MKLRIVSFHFIILILILSACGKSEIDNPLNYTVEDFTHTNQKGESFGLKDLEGNVWVANFIFTNCDDVCLPMTANMKILQDRVKEEGIENIEFVSFSVDPTIDTPEILTEFGKQFQVDDTNWNFLTGYSQESIEQFALNSFKAIVKKPQSGDQVIHGTAFYLIDQDGNVMKDYSGLGDIPMDDIINDIKILQ